MKSRAREGLDRLLAERPDADVARASLNEHWLVVFLTTGSGFQEPWAIYRRTGSVYRMRNSVVDDDPVYELE